MGDLDTNKLVIPQAGEGPSSNLWSFSEVTPCGIKAFERPCSALGLSEKNEGNFPAHPVCASDRELVFVVEDDDDLRADLLELIAEMGYLTVECSGPEAFEKNIARADTGCLVLDIRLQGGDGLSILERAREIGTALPAIMLTGMKDPLVAAESIKYGALEYILKPANEIILRRAIGRAVGVSRSQYCRRQSKLHVERILTHLTPAEEVVARMIAQGFTTKQIAGALGRSENTIKIHRHKIMSKLRVNSVASIANIYNHVGLE